MLFQLCVCRGSVWRCHCRFTRLLRPAPLVEGNFADISFRGARNVSSRRCLGIRGKSRRAGVFQSGDAVESFHGFYVFFFESVRTDFAVVANHFSARSCFSTCSLVFPKPFGFYLNYSFYLNEQFIARLCAWKFDIVIQGNESRGENRIFFSFKAPRFSRKSGLKVLRELHLNLATGQKWTMTRRLFRLQVNFFFIRPFIFEKVNSTENNLLNQRYILRRS